MLHLQHVLLLQHRSMTLALLSFIFLAQSFEAATVKPSAPSNNGRFTMNGGPGTSDPGFLRYTNVPLKRALMVAYDVKPWQIIGPDWLNTLRIDISARVQEGTTKEQTLGMLRALLEERFRMTARREPREMSYFALAADKNGARLNAATSVTDDNVIATVKRNEGKDGFPVLTPGAPGLVVETRNASSRVSAFRAHLPQLADFLASQLGRPVLDQTGIEGVFDFELYYASQNAPPGEASPYPEIFQALREQLGLRLDARKGPIEMFVIERIEKVPTENE
jgi:uncharacterized protein (TIGR03435 family)